MIHLQLHPIHRRFDAPQSGLGNMIETGTVDSPPVARAALRNGASVAGPLPTTNSLVVEEQTTVGRQPGADGPSSGRWTTAAAAGAGLRYAEVARARASVG